MIVFLVVIKIAVFYVPNKYTIHAEQDCINKLKNKSILKDCILLVIKITPSGNLINSFPCNMCDRIIKKYKVRKVIFS